MTLQFLLDHVLRVIGSEAVCFCLLERQWEHHWLMVGRGCWKYLIQKARMSYNVFEGGVVFSWRFVWVVRERERVS